MATIDTFSLTSSVQIVKRHFFTILLCVVSATVVAVGITSFLEKRYKSSAILNIQTSYFQHPLVNDLITPVSDASELQAQRLSLLKLALSEEYLDSFAERFGIYSQSLDASSRARERELLLQRIEYFSLSSTTFSISVTSNVPEKAQEMTKAILEHMQQTLISERNNALERAKHAIESHLAKLGKNLQDLDKPQGAVNVDSALQEVEGTLKGLLIRFTDSHPEVIKAKRQLALLKAQQGKISPESQTEPSMPAISKASSQQVYDELIKKLNYLTVLFDMERGSEYQSYLGVIQTPSLPVRAIFPSKRLFAVFGMMLGILSAAIIIICTELTRRRILTASESAVLLDAPWWGSLPELASVQQLPAPTKRIGFTQRRSLPAPALQS